MRKADVTEAQLGVAHFLIPYLEAGEGAYESLHAFPADAVREAAADDTRSFRFDAGPRSGAQAEHRGRCAGVEHDVNLRSVDIGDAGRMGLEGRGPADIDHGIRLGLARPVTHDRLVAVARAHEPDDAVGEVVFDVADAEHVLAQESRCAASEVVPGDDELRLEGRKALHLELLDGR